MSATENGAQIGGGNAAERRRRPWMVVSEACDRSTRPLGMRRVAWPAKKGGFSEGGPKRMTGGNGGKSNDRTAGGHGAIVEIPIVGLPYDRRGSRSGPESLQTQRWSEPDSNLWSRCEEEACSERRHGLGAAQSPWCELIPRGTSTPV